MPSIRLSQVFCVALLLGLQPLASATVTLQIRLGAGATEKEWYQMALWLEAPQGSYAQTLYVTADVGREGLGNGFWRLFGITLREVPESLPVWAHRRGVRYGKSYYPPKETPLPDTVTGATIKQRVITRTYQLDDGAAARLGAEPWGCLLELNVSRDGIPSVVFQATATPGGNPAPFRFLGYGEQKGRDGGLHDGDAFPGEFVRGATCAISSGPSKQAVP